jgi:hypothetical protein
MALRHGRRWLLATGIFLVAGHKGVSAADENEPTPEYGTPHAECSYFGPQRERFLRTELGRPGDGLSLSAVTEQVVAALPPGMRPSRSRTDPNRDTLQGNYIDQYIFAVLKRLGITPAEPAGDAEFLRRVSLDLTGRIPSGPAVAEFVADPNPDKRAQAIDRLLETPEWADRWTMFFGELYRNTLNTTQLNRLQQARDQYHYYILDSLRANKPYHEMARELVSAGGNTWEIGQANFTLSGRTTGGPVQDNYDTQAVNVSTMLLGISHLDCILCHDGAGHLDALSLWGAGAKRTDAWGMAAFFARTTLNQPGGGARPWMVADEPANGQYNLNTTSGNRPVRRAVSGSAFVAPKYMFGPGGSPTPGENWRAAMARLVTSDFQFARATVNYIWREFLVLGLVEPPDQFDPLRLDPANPPPAPWTLQPSNPYLLDSLASHFISNNYDLKALMRDIANSRAYQLSSRYNGSWNPEWEKLYARKLVRRLRAEELHDALVTSSLVPGGYTITGFRQPRIDFAMQLPDVVGMPGGAGGQFLDSFLRGNRQDDDRRSDVTIQQALSLMNGPFIEPRTRNQMGTFLYRVFPLPNDQLVNELYLNVLSRYPTPAERQAAVRELAAGNRAAKAPDLLWSLYNKVDFLFNY